MNIPAQHEHLNANAEKKKYFGWPDEKESKSLDEALAKQHRIDANDDLR